MSQRTDLLAACAAGDEAGLELLGWRGVLDMLRAWPGRVTGDMLAPYVMALGDEDPDRIVAAVRALLPPVSHYRPSASEILEELHPAAPVAGVHPARPRPPRPDQLPQTPAAAIAMAEVRDICVCLPRPTLWSIDRDGVLFHTPGCGGVEVGQYEAALDARDTDTDEEDEPA